MRTRLLLLLAMAPVAQSRAQAARSCPANDSIYTLVAADTLRGFRFTSPSLVHTPPAEYRGVAEVRMLVNPRGSVVAESTKVVGAASARDSSLLATMVASFRFYPATLYGCGINSWFSMRFNRG